MRKKLLLPIIFFLFPLFFLSLSSVVISQDFNQTYQEYLSLSSQLNSDYENFVLAKNRYLSYKTILSESEAVDASKKMMIVRNAVIKKLIEVSRIRLAQETGIINYQENLLYLNLDSQMSVYSSQSEMINSQKSLSELNEAENKLLTGYLTTKKLVYKSLVLINYKKISQEIENLKKQLQLLDEKFGEIKSSSDNDFILVNQRLEEINKKFIQIESRVNLEVKNKISLVDNSAEPEIYYAEIYSSINNIKSEFSSLLNDLNEIIFTLKNV